MTNQKTKPISPSNDDKDKILLMELLKQAVNKFGKKRILTELKDETYSNNKNIPKLIDLVSYIG